MNSFHRSHGWVRRLQGTAETKPAWFQPGPAADVRCVDFPAWHHHAAEFRKLLRARKSLRYIGVVYHDYSDPRSCVHNFILKGTSRRSRVINLSQISPTIPTLTPAKRPTAMWIRGSTEMESCRNSWKCMINAASRSTSFPAPKCVTKFFQYWNSHKNPPRTSFLNNGAVNAASNSTNNRAVLVARRHGSWTHMFYSTT